MTTSTVTQRISAFTAELTYADLPDDVAVKTKVSLLHNLGVAMAAGSLADEALSYADAVSPFDGGTGSRLLITGREVSPFTAAGINAALIHARAQDDVYFPGLTHVGATIVPALLAVGERLGSSGTELLTAMVAGYEAAGALSGGFAARTTARGFRATGIFGALGAAAAVSRLLGLDRGVTAHAIGLAACMSSGTNQTWVAGTQEWQFQVGLAATSGIRAALQASAGGLAAPDAMEGSAGFYRSFMGDCQGVADIGRDLGDHWRSRDVTYKPYPVCAILQAPVSELIALVRRHGLDAGQVNQVRLILSVSEAEYPGTDSTGPFRGVGATLMSAQFCLAVALVEGHVVATDLTRFDDASLQSIVNRVRVIADADLPARSFHLQLDLVGGGTVEHFFAGGNESCNWNRDEVVAQLMSMLDEMAIDRPGLLRLVETVTAAERHSVADLVTACVARP